MPLKLTQYWVKDKKGNPKYALANVYEGDNGKFYAVVTRKGKKKRIPCETVTDAKEALKEVDKHFPKPPPKLRTLKQLCQHYRAEDETNNENHKDHARQERNLIRLLDNPTAGDIKKGDLTAYKVARMEEGVGPATINHELKRLHRVLNQAVRDGHLVRNPIAGYRKMKQPPGRIRWLTEAEETIFEPYFTAEDWRLVEIAFLSGMRQTEQFSCKREHVLWESRTIWVPKTKNGEGRHIPMSDRLAEVIQAQFELGTDWLCPNRSRSGPWMARNFYRTFEKARDKAGLKDLVWHDLRHTFCSRLAMAGVPLRTIQKLAGHKNFSTTERYAHLSQDHLHEAVRTQDKK